MTEQEQCPGPRGPAGIRKPKLQSTSSVLSTKKYQALTMCRHWASLVEALLAKALEMPWVTHPWYELSKTVPSAWLLLIALPLTVQGQGGVKS